MDWLRLDIKELRPAESATPEPVVVPGFSPLSAAEKPPPSEHPTVFTDEDRRTIAYLWDSMFPAKAGLLNAEVIPE